MGNVKNEVSIGFNKTSGKFEILERVPGTSCWWPMTNDYPTLLAVETVLADRKEEETGKAWEEVTTEDHGRRAHVFRGSFFWDGLEYWGTIFYPEGKPGPLLRVGEDYHDFEPNRRITFPE